MQTAEEYYNDSDSFGNYQFTTLADVIDGMVMASIQDDSYLKNTRRSFIVSVAKNVIRDLTKSTSAETLAIEMTVGNNSCIVLPQDYVDYVRVSVVIVDNGARKLLPLDVNTNIITAIGYLQDNNAQLLFDHTGAIITADSSNAYNIPYKMYEFYSSCDGSSAGVDASILSANGEFKVDERRGMMVFSSNLIDKEIVLEYQSDGLQWEAFGLDEIKVHKYIVEALKDGIYFGCIEHRRTVPDSEKRRAQNKFKTSRHIAKKNRAGFDLQEISRLMRTRTKHL